MKRRGFYFRHGSAFRKSPCPAEIQIPMGEEGAEVFEIVGSGKQMSYPGDTVLGWDDPNMGFFQEEGKMLTSVTRHSSQLSALFAVSEIWQLEF